MALPKFLQFGKSYAGQTVDLSKDTASEVVEASQTSNSTFFLGSGATTLTAGDFDTVYAGKGNDFVYSARGTSLVTGPGSDTFAYGVGSKPQSPGMIGACRVDDNGTNGGTNNETIEIAKSFFGTTAAQQNANLAAAIANANSDAGLQADGSRTLTIDGKGDSITFLSGAQLDKSHFKLVEEIAFKELDSYPLNEEELIESVIRCKLDDGSGDEVERFVVGTAFLDDAESSTNSRGRILIFEVNESRQLKLVTEMSLKGACRCLAMVQGRIVAALIKTVSLDLMWSFSESCC